MPVQTYIVVINTDDGKRRTLTVVADSPASAREKAKERKIPQTRKPYTVLKVLRLHAGPPEERTA